MEQPENHLKNLKQIRDIYADALRTGDVPSKLIYGICKAYYVEYGTKYMYCYFKENPLKGNDSYTQVYVSTTIDDGATPKQALLPRIEWLDKEIKRLEGE